MAAAYPTAQFTVWFFKTYTLIINVAAGDVTQRGQLRLGYPYATKMTGKQQSLTLCYCANANSKEVTKSLTFSIRIANTAVKIWTPHLQNPNLECFCWITCLTLVKTLTSSYCIPQREDVLCPLYTNCLGCAVAELVEALCYKPEGSIPDGVTGIFHLLKPSGRTMAPGPTSL